MPDPSANYPCADRPPLPAVPWKLHVGAMNASESRSEAESPYAAIGILSVGSYVERRAMIRSTWARPPRRGEGIGQTPQPIAVAVRFLLSATETVGTSAKASAMASAKISAMRGALSREARAYGDLHFLENVRDGWHFFTKVFGWMRAALAAWPRVAWVVHADDDAYVRLDLLLIDLQLLARTEKRVVYGAFEWQALNTHTLEHPRATWGANPQMAANGWRALTSNGSNSLARQLSRPFPYAKGPLRAWDAAMAKVLTEDAYARAVLSRARDAALTKLLFDDVLIGYVLATARGGDGVSNATLVDMLTLRGSPAQRDIPLGGFLAEFRPRQQPLTSAALACARGVHFGRRATTTASAAQTTSRDNFTRIQFARLACHETAACAPRLLKCMRTAQPRWSKRTRAVVRTGKDWRDCALWQAAWDGQRCRFALN